MHLFNDDDIRKARDALERNGLWREILLATSLPDYRVRQEAKDLLVQTFADKPWGTELAAEFRMNEMITRLSALHRASRRPPRVFSQEEIAMGAEAIEKRWPGMLARLAARRKKFPDGPEDYHRDLNADEKSDLTNSRDPLKTLPFLMRGSEQIHEWSTDVNNLQNLIELFVLKSSGEI